MATHSHLASGDSTESCTCEECTTQNTLLRDSLDNGSGNLHMDVAHARNKGKSHETVLHGDTHHEQLHHHDLFHDLYDTITHIPEAKTRQHLLKYIQQQEDLLKIQKLFVILDTEQKGTVMKKEISQITMLHKDPVDPKVVHEFVDETLLNIVDAAFIHHNTPELGFDKFLPLIKELTHESGQSIAEWVDAKCYLLERYIHRRPSEVVTVHMK